MPTTGIEAEMIATVTASVMPCPTTSKNAPKPMVEPPIRIPCHQGALRNASAPSSSHQKGSKHAAAMTMRAAVKGSGGTVPNNKPAAGKPIAQISMDSMHTTLAAHVEGGTEREVMLANARSAV
jgi:hypothetical protein